MSAAADQEDTSDGTAASRTEVLEPSSSDGDPMSACHQEAEASPDASPSASQLIIPPAMVRKPRRKRSAAEPAPLPRKHFVMFEGNASKKWDGKTIAVEEEDLEGECSGADLSLGAVVELPYPGKGGKVEHWKGVIVCYPSSKSGRNGAGGR